MFPLKNRSAVVISLIAIVIIQTSILWPFKDFIQVWDGFWYWHLCLAASLDEVFNVMGFNCSDHPNMGFFLPIALFIRTRLLEPFQSVLACQWMLTSLSIPLYYGIAQSLAKPSESPLVPLLSTLAWAMHPLLLATTLMTSPEQGSVVYMLGFIWAMIHQRFWLIPIFGTLFVFTKEPMILIYGLMLVAITLYYYTKVSFFPSIFEGLFRIFKKIAIYLVPLLILAAYAYIRVYVYQLNPFHGANSGEPNLAISLSTFLRVLPLNERQAGILVMTVFNSFLGIPALLIFMALSKWIYFSFKQSCLVKVYPSTLTVALALVISLYALTRIIPYTNARYLLPLIPLMILLTPVAVDFLNIDKRFKVSIMTVMIGLLFISQTKTLDPVARWFFGTFKSGEYSFLSVTSHSGECCGGHGRDQLVYNFQFTNIFDLQNLVYAAIKPTSKTVIMYPDESLYFSTGPLDPATFRRSYKSDLVVPQFIGLSGLPTLASKEFYAISPPHAPLDRHILDLDARYALMESNTVAHKGYELNYYKFKLK